MNRRSSALLCAACATAFATGCSAQPRTAQSSGKDAPPNIVVILADDLGYADIGAQGISKDVRTPNIDSIAQNGARFTSGYVSCPVCSPTRAGFLTGRYQQRFGHEFNPGGNTPESFGLPLDQVTIADAMKQAGYHTGLVGKWHEGSMPPHHPLKRGFDEFYGFLGGAHSYIDNGAARNVILRNDKPEDLKQYLTDQLGDEAASYIQRNKEKPFFLYLAFNAIHTPQQAPQKYLDRFKDVSDKKRHYALSMLSAADDAVGKVLATLRENELEENTLVFFFSDNGGPTPGNGSRNDPLSGYKGQVWEGGIRIPFMIQWKNHLPAGKVLDQPIIQLDIFATALAAAGQKPRENLDGKNLLPLLKGETTAPPHEALYWRFGPQHAIRMGNYKLVRIADTPDALYDVVADPGEKHNLAADKPDLLKQLQDKYAAWDRTLAKPLWPSKPKFQQPATGQQGPQPRGAARRRARQTGQPLPATQEEG